MMNSSVVSGAGGLPKVILAAPDGAEAEVYLHGAHVTAWHPSNGAERLFLSASADFREGTAIRGGVPIIFPQFAGLGPLPKHGFARVAQWELAQADGSSALLRLRDSEATRRTWPFAFVAELKVVIGGRQLTIALTITNTGAQDFTFTSALHTYLRVADAQQTVIENLAGLRYRDQVLGNSEHVQVDRSLGFQGEVDRIYFNAPKTLFVRESDRTLQVTAEGFPDVVIWNPGADKGAALSDLEPNGYQQMVCVEAAAIAAPIRLNAHESWRGSQSLQA